MPQSHLYGLRRRLTVAAGDKGATETLLHRRLVRLRRLESLLLHGEVRDSRKWADKYGINIKVQRFDYAPSLDAFVAKNIDACAMTNMEALDMPAAAGVDTTAIIVGDYSNGNDAVMVAARRRAGADSRQASAAGGEDRFAISVRARHGDQWTGRSDQARSST